MKHQQRGISFIGILFVGVIVACAFVVGAQVAPTLIEFQAITKAASKAKEGGTVAEVRSTFDKAAQIDDTLRGQLEALGYEVHDNDAN